MMLQQRKVGTSESTIPLTSKPCCMPESQVKSSLLPSKTKNVSSEVSTQKQNFSLTLPLDLILKDEALSKYWNPVCRDIQSKLWLPHQTDFREVDSPSYVRSSNFTEEKLSFWRTEIQPKALTQQHSLLFSLPSATPKAEKEIVNATRKIRLYPKDKRAFDLIALHRRAYNLAIEHFKRIPYEEQSKLVELRRDIKTKVKLEWFDRKYEAEVVGEAVRTAFKTRNAVIQKRKRKIQCDYKFKSIKETSQFYVKQRLSKNIKDMYCVTEDISNESYGRTTVISFKNGRWFLNSIINVGTKAGVDNQELRIASIDPGVRTFATVFKSDSVTKYGDKFYQEKVFPLLLKLDKLLGGVTKFRNKNKGRDTSKFFYDTIRFFKKKIYKLRNRIDDLIDDLHRRVAYAIVSTSDVILLPTFKTQQMSAKVGRKLHTKTVRTMLGLKHYKFKLFIKWLAKKYGKIVLDVNEAYTSKTRSWSGIVEQNLGGRKIIKDISIRVNRDVNGARGILLRALSR